jgi:hypothetical protein
MENLEEKLISVIKEIEEVKEIKPKKNPYKDNPEYKAKLLAKMNSVVHCESCNCDFVYANQFRHNKSPKHLKNFKNNEDFKIKFQAEQLKLTIENKLKDLNKIIKYSQALKQDQTEDERKRLKDLIEERDRYLDVLKEE